MNRLECFIIICSSKGEMCPLQLGNDISPSMLGLFQYTGNVSLLFHRIFGNFDCKNKISL